jgi:hypothetical protein
MWFVQGTGIVIQTLHEKIVKAHGSTKEDTQCAQQCSSATTQRMPSNPELPVRSFFKKIVESF